MDYEVDIDFGQGGDVTVEIDVDYDWMVDMTEDYVVTNFLDNLGDDDAMEIVTDRLLSSEVLDRLDQDKVMEWAAKKLGVEVADG